jgi:hypothetical protein
MALYKVRLKDENNLAIQTKECAVIIAYFQPEHTASNIIDSLAEALRTAATNERIILCKDFNCSIDKETRTKEVLSILQEEGLKLINNKDFPDTYILYNGMSTIDLVFM